MAVRCTHCLDEGHVCESHPSRPWAGLHGPTEGHDECGGAGLPCPACCTPLPADAAGTITEVFVPAWKRQGAIACL